MSEKKTSLFSNRFPAREVAVGHTAIGGRHPIRLQSMTNTPVADWQATLEQCQRIFDAGADFVRISIPDKKALENLETIRKNLRKSGYENPLIADIHFKPELAVSAARIVEKVRINPGNFSEKAHPSKTRWSREEYSAARQKIQENIRPLILACKEYGTAIRIGTNSGSLSRRIVSRYGHTPEAMVESTLEFLKIFEDLGFFQTLVSLKASNPLLMIQSYRLMAKGMLEEKMPYPLHVGVTEAGAGETGRIKSALGISTLLKWGIGDTIRVSLTEEPEKEIGVAKKITAPFQKAFTFQEKIKRSYSIPQFEINSAPPKLPADHKALVVNSSRELTRLSRPPVSFLSQEASGLDFSPEDPEADLVILEAPGEKKPSMGGRPFFCIPADLITRPHQADVFPVFAAEAPEKKHKGVHPVFNLVKLNHLPDTSFFEKLKELPGPLLILDVDEGFPFERFEGLTLRLESASLNAGLIVKNTFKEKDEEDFMIELAESYGSLLLQKKIHGLWIEAPSLPTGQNPNPLIYKLFQTAGLRHTQTEFISCPTCARTSFDLQGVLQQIKKELSGFPGLTIAVMGCVVNGPGEMADADYGILGTGSGKVHIYRGKTVIKKNIPPQKALETLKEVLKREKRNLFPENQY